MGGGGAGGGAPRPPGKPASMATFKRELRREIKRRAHDPEINFLNITAMLDMMTIILVFLLKSLSASTAALPQAADLTIPKSTLTTEATQEGCVVMVTKTRILVDNEPVVELPADKTLGVNAKDKRGGPNDLYITPLANQLQRFRDIDKRVRAALGKPLGSEAVVVADDATPYRLLVEVLFTLGQSEFTKFHLMVLQGGK